MFHLFTFFTVEKIYSDKRYSSYQTLTCCLTGSTFRDHFFKFRRHRLLGHQQLSRFDYFGRRDYCKQSIFNLAFNLHQFGGIDQCYCLRGKYAHNTWKTQYFRKQMFILFFQMIHLLYPYKVIIDLSQILIGDLGNVPSLVFEILS